MVVVCTPCNVAKGTKIDSIAADSELGKEWYKQLNHREKGMSMLADIISNAPPMRTNTYSQPSNSHLQEKNKNCVLL